jgi:stage III sporulation protein AH
MAVINMRKIKSPVLTVIALIIFSVLATGVISYGREYQAARADRTNAMQVVKPLANDQNVPVAVSDFFTEYRLERDRLRSERSDLLREVIKNSRTDEARHKAHDAVLKMVLDKERESEMENLIKARGFADALVFVRDSTVNVVVKTGSLNRDEVIQVADIISRVAGVKPEDITISAKP